MICIRVNIKIKKQEQIHEGCCSLQGRQFRVLNNNGVVAQLASIANEPSRGREKDQPSDETLSGNLGRHMYTWIIRWNWASLNLVSFFFFFSFFVLR